jgi:hypothetical protein
LGVWGDPKKKNGEASSLSSGLKSLLNIIIMHRYYNESQIGSLSKLFRPEMVT